MLGRIIHGDGPIKVRRRLAQSPAGVHQGSAHQVVADNQREAHALLLGEREILGRKFVHHLAVENVIKLAAQKPDRTENNNKGSSSGSPIASACSICDLARSRAVWFREPRSPLTARAVRKSDLELNLLSTKCGGRGQGLDLVERTGKLGDGLN